MLHSFVHFRVQVLQDLVSVRGHSFQCLITQLHLALQHRDEFGELLDPPGRRLQFRFDQVELHIELHTILLHGVICLFELILGGLVAKVFPELRDLNEIFFETRLGFQGELILAQCDFVGHSVQFIDRVLILTFELN